MHIYSAHVTRHFHHTWVVFYNIVLKQISVKHTKSWETWAYQTCYGIYDVLTQEVGGCFYVVHRNYSLRCLVTPNFPLIDQFLYRFSTYWPKINKFWMLEVSKKVFYFYHSAIENFNHHGHPMFAKKVFGAIFSVKECFRL